MECLYSEHELTWRDFYGKHRWEMGLGVTGMRDHWEKSGDIYKCENEECPGYELHFHTRNGELIEGFPC